MHFWTDPEMEEGKDCSETTGQLAPEVDVTDGLMLLAKKLVVNTSVPPLAYDLQLINTDSEYLVCHSYVCEQVDPD